MQRKPDFEGMFHLSATGRSSSIVSGYRPQHAIHTNYQTSGEHTYLDCEVLEPGQSARVEVRLITPEVYPHCLWEGRELSVQEGGLLVSTLLGRNVRNRERVAPKLQADGDKFY
jgi:translation elongation factor EF-Tu-like GTPase